MPRTGKGQNASPTRMPQSPPGKRWSDGGQNMQRQLDRAEDEGRRRQVLSFCSRCWKCTSFRGNAKMVKDMSFMERLHIFDHRTAEGTSLRLRKELEETEWDDIIRTRLKWGVAPGPNHHPTDMIKTMSAPEREILRL